MAYLETVTDMIKLEYIWLALLTIIIFIVSIFILPHFRFLYISNIPFGLLFGIILIWFRRYILSIFVVMLFGLWSINSFGQSPYMLAVYLLELLIANRIIAPDISDRSMVPLVLYTIFCMFVNNIAEAVLAVSYGSSLSTALELMLVLVPVHISYGIIVSILLYLIVKKIAPVRS